MLVLALCLVVLVVVDGSVESGDDRDLLSSKKDDGNLTHYFRAGIESMGNIDTCLQDPAESRVPMSKVVNWR